jgi:hypothetical protein
MLIASQSHTERVTGRYDLDLMAMRPRLTRLNLAMAMSRVLCWELQW